MTHEKIRKALKATGGPHLGDVLYWTLADARVTRSTLEQVWTGAGLDPALLPEPPTAERTIKAAARSAAIGQADRLVRPALETERQIAFGIVREQKSVDGSLSYAHEASVTLDRDTEVAFTDVPGHVLARAILARFQEQLGTHSSDDIRRGVMNVLGSCAAITLRDHGGVYFVPAPHAGTLSKLQAAVEKLGNSKLYLLPVHSSADANRTLGDAAKLAIEDELAALKVEVEGFMASPPDRPSTLVRRLDAFSELQARAELYKQVLFVTVADLDQTLATLTASVEQLLNAKAAA